LANKLPTAERREKLLQSALEIIDTQGFSRLTIRKIAGLNGISEAAVYRHYRNKTEIIDALASFIFQNNPVLLILEKKGENPVSRLEKALEEQLEWLQNNPRLSSVLFQEEIFLEYPHIRERFNAHRRHKERVIIELIVEGQKKGIINSRTDARAFALLFMGGIRVSVLRWRGEGYSYSLEEEGPPLWKSLFRLLQ